MLITLKQNVVTQIRQNTGLVMKCYFFYFYGHENQGFFNDATYLYIKKNIKLVITMVLLFKNVNTFLCSDHSLSFEVFLKITLNLKDCYIAKRSGKLPALSMNIQNTRKVLKCKITGFKSVCPKNE